MGSATLQGPVSGDSLLELDHEHGSLVPESRDRGKAAVH